MFGYIDLNPKKLTPEQTGRYKAWYCGLCREIRNRYGQLGRMVLSNDMTFLTVLLSSLYEPEEESGSANCPLHPVRKRDFIQSSATAYAADMNLLLAYWKYRDAERDRERGIQKQLASRLNSAYDEICKAYPEQPNRFLTDAGMAYKKGCPASGSRKVPGERKTQQNSI